MRNKPSPESLTSKCFIQSCLVKFIIFGDSDNNGVRTKNAVFSKQKVTVVSTRKQTVGNRDSTGVMKPTVYHRSGCGEQSICLC